MKHETDEEAVENASLYALDALDGHEARLFEAHLAEGCNMCHNEARSFDPVIASLAACLPEATPSPRVRERLLTLLAEETHSAERPLTSTGTIETEILKIRASEGVWSKIGDGVFKKTLFKDRQRGTTTSLIKVDPGAQIPPHRHADIEECLVVEGDIYSGSETFSRGDYLCAPAGSVHEHLFSANGALLFIVAAA